MSNRVTWISSAQNAVLAASLRLVALDHASVVGSLDDLEAEHREGEIDDRSTEERPAPSESDDAGDDADETETGAARPLNPKPILTNEVVTGDRRQSPSDHANVDMIDKPTAIQLIVPIQRLTRAKTELPTSIRIANTLTSLAAASRRCSSLSSSATPATYRSGLADRPRRRDD